MLLTKRNEYALQAMILLARQKKGKLQPASSLARALRTTPAFMSKIAQQLIAAGLVISKKGKGGGLFLARPAGSIRVWHIFSAVDGELAVSACVKEGRCKHHICPVYPALSRLQKDLDKELNSARLDKFV